MSNQIASLAAIAVVLLAILVHFGQLHFNKASAPPSLHNRINELVESTIFNSTNLAELVSTSADGYGNEVVRMIVKQLHKPGFNSSVNANYTWSEGFRARLRAVIQVCNQNSIKSRDAVAEAGAVQILLPFLDSGMNVSSKISRNITHLFTTISLTGTPSTMHSLVPIIPQMVRLMDEGSNEEWRADAMWALYQLSTKNLTRRTMIADAGGLRPLIALTLAKSGEVRQGAAWTMAMVIGNNSTRASQAVEDGALVNLISQLDAERDGAVVSALAAALNNIVARNETRASLSIDAGALKVLVKVLNRRAHYGETAVHHAADVLSLIAYNKATRLRVAGALVPEAVIQAIKEELFSKNYDGEALQSLCMTLANVASEPLMADTIVNLGAAPVLIHLMNTTTDDDILYAAVWALNNAGVNNDIRTKAVALAGGVQACANVLPRLKCARSKHALSMLHEMAAYTANHKFFTQEVRSAMASVLDTCDDSMFWRQYGEEALIVFLGGQQ